MALPENMVTNVLSENQNQFITVKFLTKDDEVRVYNGRMNVIKGLKGNERGKIAAAALKAHGYVTLKTSEGYKCFKMDRVLAFKAGGRHVFGLGNEIV
jgi:hypothetical protein